MKRQQLYILIILTLTYGHILGQSNKIIFEQKALDYFADSILNKMNPFRNVVAHFDGIVDSSITTIQYEMTEKYPDDTELLSEYQKRCNATTEFWEENKRPPFSLVVEDPIKKRSKKQYENKNTVIRLMVFQSKNVGIRNFVWFRAFGKSGDGGYDIYFTLDSDGRIINWYYETFIF